MKTIVLAVISGAVSMASGQFSSPMIGGANPEYRHLYDRVSRSAIVVQGKIVEQQFVRKRGVPAVVREGPTGYRTADIDDITGGRLYTVDISVPLCRQEDFIPGMEQKRKLQNTMQVFVSSDPFRDSDLFPGIDAGIEQLFKGGEYLLFLFPYPRQEELQKKYELGPEVTYYKVFDGYFGARELAAPVSRGTDADRTTPLISAVSALCEAVKPTDVKAKLSGLRELRGRADSRWRDSVDAAIRALEAYDSAQPLR